MITFALLTLLALTVAGFVALYHAHKSATDGYEDDIGFHPGVEPIHSAEIHDIHADSGRAA
jgi:hypothetical protein